MKAAHLRSLAFLLAAPLLAQDVPRPVPGVLTELTVNLVPGVVDFYVHGPQAPFVGIVIGGLNPDLAHYFVGLPPLLADSFVFAWGVTQELRYHAAFPETAFPPGVMIHVQGVTISEAGILASRPREFVLDATGGIVRP